VGKSSGFLLFVLPTGGNIKISYMQNTALLKGLQYASSRPVTDGIIELDALLPTHEPLSILRLEDLHKEIKGFVPPLRLSNFLILFVKKGAGKRSISHYNFTIRDNSFVVIPGRVTQAATYTRPPEGYLISFNPDFFLHQAFSYKHLNSKRVLQHSHPPITVVNKEKVIEISAIFEKIIDEYTSDIEANKQMIALKILELLIICDRFFPEKANQHRRFGQSKVLATFNELIEKHFSEHRSVQFFADQLHIHPNHLNAIVKKATGISAKQTIINRVMIEAKYLLLATSLSIKEIAYELGFESTNYFFSFFKKEQRQSPAHYRVQPI
jgi:AraC family transcriptional activator of pobA